jgi:hypothetical protein
MWKSQENPVEILLETISELNKVMENKVNIQKSIVFIYIYIHNN